MSKEVIIYGIKNPFTNKIDYVGKSLAHTYMQRTAEHIRGSKKSSKEMKDCAKKIRSEGNPYHRVIIEYLYVESDQEWAEREIYWIDTLKSLGEARYNKMGGGQNPPIGSKENALLALEKGREKGAFQLGHKHSEESKKQMSESAKARGNNKPEGWQPSKEQIERQCNAMKIKYGGKIPPHLDTLESRRKAAETRRGFKHTENTLEKIREARANQVFSADSIERKSQTLIIHAKENPEKHDPVASGAVEAAKPFNRARKGESRPQTSQSLTKAYEEGRREYTAPTGEAKEEADRKRSEANKGRVFATKEEYAQRGKKTSQTMKEKKARGESIGGPAQKLTNEQRMEIYNRFNDGEKKKPLAREYGVSPKTITNVINEFNE